MNHIFFYFCSVKVISKLLLATNLTSLKHFILIKNLKILLIVNLLILIHYQNAGNITLKLLFLNIYYLIIYYFLKQILLRWFHFLIDCWLQTSVFLFLNKTLTLISICPTHLSKFVSFVALGMISMLLKPVCLKF